MRIAYQYHQLSDKSKNLAKENNKVTDLTQWLYNKDGSTFETSTTVNLN